MSVGRKKVHCSRSDDRRKERERERDTERERERERERAIRRERDREIAGGMGWCKHQMP